MPDFLLQFEPIKLQKQRAIMDCQIWIFFCLLLELGKKEKEMLPDGCDLPPHPHPSAGGDREVGRNEQERAGTSRREGGRVE